MQSCYIPFHWRRPSKLFSKTAGQKIVAANARKKTTHPSLEVQPVCLTDPA